MARFHSVKLFFNAAGKSGVASMAFALVPLFISIYEHTKDKNVSAFLNLILAATLIMWGCYLAWNEEHKKLETELEKNSHPEFQIEVSRLFHDVTPIQGIPWLDCGNTYVAKLSLVNVRSVPSSVRDVYVMLGEQVKKFSAKPFDVTRISWQKEGITRVFMGESVTEYSGQEETIHDLLKSLGEPMTRGEHKDGWVYLSDLPSVDSSEAFQFYAVDAFGISHGPFIPKIEMDMGNVKR